MRLALGATLTALPAPLLVDRFVELPTDGRWFDLLGERVQIPQFADAEEFVALLVRRGSVVLTDIEGISVTDRTRQRRYLAAVGLPKRTVIQIERANDAAVQLSEGRPPATVAHEAGYFDQPHLARSLRRFIGPSATELADRSEDETPLSLLYKTGGRSEQ
ncbi:hypothetical protein ACRAWB_00120 [Leifsonia poae]|uniref:hypothetical protein n=1 Tax=Leifsonia poae TaxID=110933 RepID=UPI003D6897AC